MPIRSIGELAAVVRGRRLALGLSQGQLAREAGLSREWVNAFEGGKPSVELALVFRVLDALGLDIDVVDRDQHIGHSRRTATQTATARIVRPASVDLDTLLDEYRNR